ncbi:hypothetical protein [Faecalibacter macacae]|uniref:Uncharacterized protein n=1 Tax=Faecalibacter macacae TaxID=1859289 RepID=A0A3L9M0P9_9FLAO|nr:hypothetical protein [Faecalibacter macacae]RLZ06488.1 hypothetical protein EAH69_13205 [Faecalibacter macacae]
MKYLLSKFCLFLAFGVNAQNFDHINSQNVIDLIYSSSVNVNQIGDLNNVSIISQKEAMIIVSQQGINNNTQYLDNNRTDLSPNIKLESHGINNTINVFGLNSITENMGIFIKGNDKTVIVENR